MGSRKSETSESVINPEVWVDNHGDFLYRYALARVRDPKVAEDLVQETFLAALKARERFSGKSSERTWFVGILKHKMIDQFRKSGREKPISDIISEDEGAIEELFDKVGKWKIPPEKWDTDPDKTFEQNEFWETVQFCLSKLQSRFADIFVLREMEEMSTEEICETMNISKSNLWVILHRARHQLRNCLEINWFSEGRAKNANV